MKCYPKRIVQLYLLLSLSLILASSSIQAQDVPTYDSSTGRLNLPVVEVLDKGESTCYSSQLQIAQPSDPAKPITFHLTHAEKCAGGGKPAKIFGLNLGPYIKEGEDPTQGHQVDKLRLTALMGIIKPYVFWVRTYGSCNDLKNAGRIAHSLGLKAALGAWLSSDTKANEQQIACLIAAAQAGEADLLIVGSENFQRNDLTEGQLIEYMQQVKQAAPHLQVAHADTLKLIKHPALIEVSDVLLVNIYPYWDGVHIDAALSALEDAYQQIKAVANGKQIIISETGWPSEGDQIGQAVPSPENASRYFKDFICWASANQVDFFYFEAFDEPWKAIFEGPQGAHWGIFNNSGYLKSGMESFFDEQFCDK